MPYSKDPEKRAQQQAAWAARQIKQPKRGTIFERQCKATSKRTGKRCGSYALKGCTVCRRHGGRMQKRGLSPYALRHPESREAMQERARLWRAARRAAGVQLVKDWPLERALPENIPAIRAELARLQQQAEGRLRFSFRLRLAQAMIVRRFAGGYASVKEFQDDAEQFLGFRPLPWA
jgi:hypothetical protein